MRKLFLAALLPLFVSGCGIFSGGLVKKYDPLTVGQIDATVKYENSAFDAMNRELTALSILPDVTTLPAQVEALKLSIKVRHDSEISRLAGWRMAEDAKEGAPKPPTAPPVTPPEGGN